MKKLFCILLAAVILTGCGTPQTFTIDGKTKEYPTFGFVNESNNKSDKVCYEVSLGNIVWSILLIETIVMPVYFIGWSIYEPVAIKDPKLGCEKSTNIDNK